MDKKEMAMVAKIGDRVRDRVSGIEGIVSGYAKWISGCDSVSVRTPPKDGKMGESYWFDINIVDVIEPGAVKAKTAAEIESDLVGGPMYGEQSPK